MDSARRLRCALPIAIAFLLAVTTAAALPEVGTAAKKRADLALGFVSKPPASAAPGSSFRATDITKNRGRAAARPSKTRFYLSLNSKKDAADLPLGQRRVKRLRKRKVSKGTVTLRVPANAAARAYVLLACADYARKLRESNERNNCRASRARIQVRPAAAGGGGGGGGGGGAPASGDRDGDGTPNESDCGPDDATIKPGAPDKPDLAFTDSNCDGIDGNQAGAVFVSPIGSDANPGTRAQPRLTVQAGIDAAASGTPKDVYLAAGNYSGGAALADGVGVYGGYDPVTWARSLGSVSAISGAPQGALADGDTGVVLQLLTLHGTALAPAAIPYDPSVYGLRAVGGSAVTVQSVAVDAVAGATGANGTAGTAPVAAGEEGTDGTVGSSGSSSGGGGGPGGTGLGGTQGGAGGKGGYGTEAPTSGSLGAGSPGSPGSPSGSVGSGQGGPGGDTSPACFTNAETGGMGTDGDNGAAGGHGGGGLFSNALAGDGWAAAGGAAGAIGSVGHGGGGGGGGGGSGGVCANDRGGGGGGGGAGGQPGTGGGGGGYGGGSFALYLHDSTLTVSSSELTAANGGAGGDGAAGGAGATGGLGGDGGGGPDDGGNGGPGGKGGTGGPGGAGGGGPGGPSYGIFKGGSSTATVASTPIFAGSGGPGGAAGTGSTNNGAAGASAATAP